MFDEGSGAFEEERGDISRERKEGGDRTKGREGKDRHKNSAEEDKTSLYVQKSPFFSKPSAQPQVSTARAHRERNGPLWMCPSLSNHAPHRQVVSRHRDARLSHLPHLQLGVRELLEHGWRLARLCRMVHVQSRYVASIHESCIFHVERHPIRWTTQSQRCRRAVFDRRCPSFSQLSTSQTLPGSTGVSTGVTTRSEYSNVV